MRNVCASRKACVCQKCSPASWRSLVRNPLRYSGELKSSFVGLRCACSSVPPPPPSTPADTAGETCLNPGVCSPALLRSPQHFLALHTLTLRIGVASNALEGMISCPGVRLFRKQRHGTNETESENQSEHNDIEVVSTSCARACTYGETTKDGDASAACPQRGHGHFSLISTPQKKKGVQKEKRNAGKQASSRLLDFIRPSLLTFVTERGLYDIISSAKCFTPSSSPWCSRACAGRPQRPASRHGER